MPTLDDQIIETILERISNGEILTAVCAELGCRPSIMLHRADRDPSFWGERYTRARRLQAAALAEDVVRITDEEKDPQRARVRSDARKWLAARLDPARFGDKLTMDGTLQVGLENLVTRSLNAIEPPTIEHEEQPERPDWRPEWKRKRKTKAEMQAAAKAKRVAAQHD